MGELGGALRGAGGALRGGSELGTSWDPALSGGGEARGDRRGRGSEWLGRERSRPQRPGCMHLE